MSAAENVDEAKKLLESVEGEFGEALAHLREARDKLRVVGSLVEREPNDDFGMMMDALAIENAKNPLTGPEIDYILRFRLSDFMREPMPAVDRVDMLVRELARTSDGPMRRRLMDWLQMCASSYVRSLVSESCATFKILPPEKATDEMLKYDDASGLFVTWNREPCGVCDSVSSTYFDIPMARAMSSMERVDVDEMIAGKDTLHVTLDEMARALRVCIDDRLFDDAEGICFNADGPF